MPTLLDRTFRLKICNQQEQKLLNINRQLPQASSNLLLDENLIFYHGYIITFIIDRYKSYLN